MSWLLILALLFALPASFAEQTEDAEALPEAFDLRSVDTDGDGVGDRCYVPPVRQQNPFGTCWGFAATAASEISILGSILDYDPDAWKTINLSEKQLAYFTHVPLTDENNPQNGEGFVTEGKDAVSVYNTGGSLFLAACSYAQGIGPSKEDNEEYGDLFRYSGREKNTLQRFIGGAYRNFCYSDMDDGSIPEEYRFARDYYLKESMVALYLGKQGGQSCGHHYRMGRSLPKGKFPCGASAAGGWCVACAQQLGFRGGGVPELRRNELGHPGAEEG